MLGKVSPVRGEGRPGGRMGQTAMRAIDLIFTNVASVEGTVLLCRGRRRQRQVARSTVGSPSFRAILRTMKRPDLSPPGIMTRSGMFWSRIPAATRDSVNPYAGFGNNPVTCAIRQERRIWEDFVAGVRGPRLRSKRTGPRRAQTAEQHPRYLARHVAARAQTGYPG